MSIKEEKLVLNKNFKKTNKLRIFFELVINIVEEGFTTTASIHLFTIGNKVKII